MTDKEQLVGRRAWSEIDKLPEGWRIEIQKNPVDGAITATLRSSRGRHVMHTGRGLLSSAVYVVFQMAREFSKRTRNKNPDLRVIKS